MYVVTVAKPVADAAGPSVFLDGGGTSLVSSAITGLHAMQVGGANSGNLQIQTTGTVHLGNDYVQQANGVLSVEFNASTLGHSIVQADGATLAGTLSVQLGVGFSPVIGNDFHILDTATGIQGAFGNVTLPALAPGLAWDLVYDASSVSLRVVLQGDYNQDNHVDAADYVTWRRAVSQIVPNGNGADGNYDGHIDALDYNMWRQNFNASAAGSSPIELQVPEPRGIVMVALCVFLVAVWRRQ